MPTREQITEALLQSDEQAILLDGFEEAFIGFSQRVGERVLVVYSYDKMVDVLVLRDKMTYSEAAEFVDYNCVGARIGDGTPIIVESL